MQKEKMITLNRYLLYTGISVQLIYIFVTPFIEMSMFILFSTVMILTAGYIDLLLAKKELDHKKSDQELSWDIKRKQIQKYYNIDDNLNKSFSDCLTNLQVAETHNERISKILDNYLSHDKKFKIKLNRKPENRIDQYLHEE